MEGQALHYREFFKYWLCAGLALLFPLGAQASVQDLAWQDGIPAYQEVKGSITHDGPKLIFSDSPEMVGKTGIMYRDTVEGPVRLFFHHVNDTPHGQTAGCVPAPDYPAA